VKYNGFMGRLSGIYYLTFHGANSQKVRMNRTAFATRKVKEFVSFPVAGAVSFVDGGRLVTVMTTIPC